MTGVAVDRRRVPGAGPILEFILLKRWALLLVLFVVLVVVYSNTVIGFLTFRNLAGSTAFGVEFGILALAQTLVIVTGGGAIDLSVGSSVSLSGVILGELVTKGGMGFLPAVVLTLLAGLLLGSINGFLIAVLRLPALIVTLATLFAYAGLAIVITSGVDISNLPPQLYSLTANWGEIPKQTVLIYLPIAIIVALLMRFTVFGRNLYGAGTNELAARFAGAPVVKIRFAVFAIAGLLAAVVSIVTSSRVASVSAIAGQGLELQSIVIAVLGGVAITGGVAAIAPVVIATFLITMLNNGMEIANIDPSYQKGALGALLLLSALLNSYASRRRGLS